MSVHCRLSFDTAHSRMPTGRCSVMLAPRSYTVLALGSPVCRPCKLGRIPLFASLQCLGPVERIACCKHQQMTAAHTHASVTPLGLSHHVTSRYSCCCWPEHGVCVCAYRRVKAFLAPSQILSAVSTKVSRHQSINWLARVIDYSHVALLVLRC